MNATEVCMRKDMRCVVYIDADLEMGLDHDFKYVGRKSVDIGNVFLKLGF